MHIGFADFFHLHDTSVVWIHTNVQPLIGCSSAGILDATVWAAGLSRVSNRIASSCEIAPVLAF